MYERLHRQILPKMIPPRARILAAVSGGPDSVALCHILWRYVCEHREKGLSLVVTHVHHGVREESDDEALLVQDLAAGLGIPCIIHRFDAKKYAESQGQSFQEAARAWRYARWSEDMRREECSLLATAHHLGDQAETIVHRLLRGSGPSGLAGIHPDKDSLIRPLLTFDKKDILRYCVSEDLKYAVDSTNYETVYLRNRIRLELLPELEKNYNPRIKEVLGQTGEIMRWDEMYFANLTETAWEKYGKTIDGEIALSRDVFSEPAAMLSRLLRKAASLATGVSKGLSFRHIKKIMDSEGKIDWKQDLPGLTVRVTREGIIFACSLLPAESGAGTETENKSETGLILGSWVDLSGLKFKIGLWREKDFAASRGESDCAGNETALFGKELLAGCCGRLVCRTRRQGDVMWLRGVGHKTLKKIFQEAGVPSQTRNKLPLLAAGPEVLWIPGVRQSGLFPPGRGGEGLCCVLRPLEASL